MHGRILSKNAKHDVSICHVYDGEVFRLSRYSCTEGGNKNAESAKNQQLTSGQKQFCPATHDSNGKEIENERES